MEKVEQIGGVEKDRQRLVGGGRSTLMGDVLKKKNQTITSGGNVCLF